MANKVTLLPLLPRWILRLGIEWGNGRQKCMGYHTPSGANWIGKAVFTYAIPTSGHKDAEMNFFRWKIRAGYLFHVLEGKYTSNQIQVHRLPDEIQIHFLEEKPSYFYWVKFSKPHKEEDMCSGDDYAGKMKYHFQLYRAPKSWAWWRNILPRFKPSVPSLQGDVCSARCAWRIAYRTINRAEN